MIKRVLKRMLSSCYAPIPTHLPLHFCDRGKYRWVSLDLCNAAHVRAWETLLSTIARDAGEVVAEKGMWSGRCLITHDIAHHFFSDKLELFEEITFSAAELRSMGIPRHASIALENSNVSNSSKDKGTSCDETLLHDALHPRFLQSQNVHDLEVILTRCDGQHINLIFVDDRRQRHRETIMKYFIECSVRLVFQYIPSREIDSVFPDFFSPNEQEADVGHSGYFAKSLTQLGKDMFYDELKQNHVEMPNTVVVFMDIENFSGLTLGNENDAVFHRLRTFYARVDECCMQYHGLRKLEVAGDSYVALSHQMMEQSDTSSSSGSSIESVVRFFHASKDMRHAEKAIHFCADIIRIANETRREEMPIRVRLGIDMGTVLSGIIGKFQPKFSVVGDVMIRAARLQTTSHPNCVHMTQSFYIAYKHVLSSEHHWCVESSEHTQLKGIGSELTVYLCRC